MNEPVHQPNSPSRPSRLPLVATAALIVLAIVAAIALGLGGVSDQADGTPEAAVQDYLDAALSGDSDALLAVIAPEVRGRCETDINDRLRSSSGIGFTLESVMVEGDTATVIVNERFSSNDAFGSTSRRGDETLELGRDQTGDWFVTTASWPFTVRDCMGPDQ